MRKVTGPSFEGYKRRESLFPKRDQTLFYDANKEFTMKGLKATGALPWNRMTNRTTVDRSDHECPEDSYDIMKAIDMKTQKLKPRSIVLADFGRTTARDEKLLNITDGYVNVKLENTREDRELEIIARKEARARYNGDGSIM